MFLYTYLFIVYENHIHMSFHICYDVYENNIHMSFSYKGVAMQEIITINSHDVIEDRQSIGYETYKKFIDYVDGSEKTVQTYTRNLKQFFKYLYENGIQEPKRDDVLAYRNELLKSKKASTVQNYLTVVKIFFSWCENENIYPNISKNLKGVKISKSHKKDNLTTWQVKEILKDIDQSTPQGIRDYAILSLLFTTGMRTIEVARAKLSDLSTIGNTPILYIQGKGRTDKTDYVKLQPQVEKAIRNTLKSRDVESMEEPLFTSFSNRNVKNHLSTRSISKIVKEAFIKAGFDNERLTAHSTRHTAITIALEAGRSIQEVQQFARHTNINTTLIYAHNLERANNQCEASIGQAIF